MIPGSAVASSGSRLKRRRVKEGCRFADMVVVAKLGAAYAGKEALGLVRASAVRAVGLFVIDPAHLETAMQTIP